MHYYKDGGIGSAMITGNFVPGHEFAANVVADDSGEFAPGELVAVDPARPCGTCEWCRRSHHNLCPAVNFTGAPPIDGALTYRMVVSHEQCFRVLSGVDDDLGSKGSTEPSPTRLYTVAQTNFWSYLTILNPWLRG